MNKNSGDFVRVAEPLSSVKLQKLNFNFDNQDTRDSEVFGITKKGGIVFIKNAELLRTFNYSQFT